MKYCTTCIILFLLLVSCKINGDISPEKPDNLLSEKQMVDVIYDMALLSAAKSTSRNLLEQKNVDPEEFVYRKHGIDSLQFAESNDYYSHDLDIYESIYQKVKLRLDKNKEVFQEEVNQERIKSDSLRDARKKLKDSLGVEDIKTPVPLKNIDSSKILKRQ